MGRFINESVQQVMEEILSTKLKINHYSNFAPFVLRHGFKAAERFGLKNDVTPVEEASFKKVKPGTIHIQWHGSHIDTNGTTMAQKYGIMYSYLSDSKNSPWLALCLAKMAQEGRILVKAGYLNPRGFDTATAREEYWTWIAGHFGSSSKQPTADSDPELFAKILGEEDNEQQAPTPEVKTSVYNDSQNKAISNLKKAGIDFSKPGETLATKPTPEILADLEVAKTAGILDYVEQDGLVHYEINKGVVLEQKVAIISRMKITANPFITEKTANGATFTKGGRSITWIHGAVLAEGDQFLGNAGTIIQAQRIAHAVLTASSINEAISARVAKINAENVIAG